MEKRSGNEGMREVMKSSGSPRSHRRGEMTSRGKERELESIRSRASRVAPPP